METIEDFKIQTIEDIKILLQNKIESVTKEYIEKTSPFSLFKDKAIFLEEGIEGCDIEILELKSTRVIKKM